MLEVARLEEHREASSHVKRSSLQGVWDNTISLIFKKHGMVQVLIEVNDFAEMVGEVWPYLTPLSKKERRGLLLRSEDMLPVRKSVYQTNRKLLESLRDPEVKTRPLRKSSFATKLLLALQESLVPVTSTQMAVKFGVSINQVSKHLAYLTKRKLLDKITILHPGKGQPRYQYKAVM